MNGYEPGMRIQYLSSEHDIGGPLDSVDQGLPAAVEVVELGLGHGVVDVDGGDLQGLLGEHLVQVVHTSGGLLRQALDSLMRQTTMIKVPCSKAHLDVLGELLVDEVGEIATIVKDHVQGLAIGEDEGLFNAPDVFLISLSLPGVDGHTHSGNGCGGVVLGGHHFMTNHD